MIQYLLECSDLLLTEPREAITTNRCGALDVADRGERPASPVGALIPYFRHGPPSAPIDVGGHEGRRVGHKPPFLKCAGHSACESRCEVPPIPQPSSRSCCRVQSVHPARMRSSLASTRSWFRVALEEVRQPHAQALLLGTVVATEQPRPALELLWPSSSGREVGDCPASQNPRQQSNRLHRRWHSVLNKRDSNPPEPADWYGGSVDFVAGFG